MFVCALAGAPHALSADLTMLHLLLHGGVTCQLLRLPFSEQPVTQMSPGPRESAGAFMTVQVQQRARHASAREHAKEAKLPKYAHVVINPNDCANTEPTCMFPGKMKE